MYTKARVDIYIYIFSGIYYRVLIVLTYLNALISFSTDSRSFKGMPPIADTAGSLARILRSQYMPSMPSRVFLSCETPDVWTRRLSPVNTWAIPLTVRALLHSFVPSATYCRNVGSAWKTALGCRNQGFTAWCLGLCYERAAKQRKARSQTERPAKFRAFKIDDAKGRHAKTFEALVLLAREKMDNGHTRCC